ncbi:MAG TPA: biotin--[acetyl-CoA-carboxylase] ligase [Bacteroidales bacterium]|nr:biotin--[acetyl-CoA-carboxylase] ligase [Bacteroidales bacterium]
MIIGTKIIYREELPSTNTYALSLLASEKPPEGTIIRTGFQSAGRGQPGNTWESEAGKNLLFSIILYPEMISPDEQFLVSMTVSLGLHDFVSRSVKDSAIKWPNDIYVKDDKIAGILIESSTIGKQVQYMIAGIGININQEKFTGPARNPVSLRQVNGIEYDLDRCLYDLSHDLDSRYSQLRHGREGEIVREYHSRLFRKDQWTVFSDKNGSFEGKINNVGADGRLTLERRSGSRSDYYFKEVEFIL